MNTTVSTMFGRTNPEDEAYLKDLVSQGEDLTIVGIVQPSEGVGYRDAEYRNRLSARPLRSM